MLMNRREIAARIPHAGTMCLLDAVLAVDADSITCLAQAPLHADNPLAAEGTLGIWTLIEYGAQAAAIHKGMQGDTTRPGPGGRAAYIAQVKEIRTTRPTVPAGPLTVSARCLVSDGGAAAYQINIAADGELLLSGRVTLALG